MARARGATKGPANAAYQGDADVTTACLLAAFDVSHPSAERLAGFRLLALGLADLHTVARAQLEEG